MRDRALLTNSCDFNAGPAMQRPQLIHWVMLHRRPQSRCVVATLQPYRARFRRLVRSHYQYVSAAPRHSIARDEPPSREPPAPERNRKFEALALDRPRVDVRRTDPSEPLAGVRIHNKARQVAPRLDRPELMRTNQSDGRFPSTIRKVVGNETSCPVTTECARASSCTLPSCSVVGLNVKRKPAFANCCPYAAAELSL
jgi:hypothetical protein